MTIARLCPICGTQSVERILRDTLLSAHIQGLACPSAGAMAYHCGEGHVFLIVGETFRWKEPFPEGNGCSLVV
jgi:hypothetical protein